MSNTTLNWTPGPWTATAVPEENGPEFWLIDACPAPNQQTEVAELCVKPGGKSRANARLIAAAPDLYAALEAALLEWDLNTCVHEDTVRGGVEWTICQQCGRKWSDRDGGFQPYEDPPRIAEARGALAKARGETL